MGMQACNQMVRACIVGRSGHCSSVVIAAVLDGVRSRQCAVLCASKRIFDPDGMRQADGGTTQLPPRQQILVLPVTGMGLQHITSPCKALKALQSPNASLGCLATSSRPSLLPCSDALFAGHEPV
jgi:hypothetical protein